MINNSIVTNTTLSLNKYIGINLLSNFYYLQ
jgi:hypothetical protein